MSAGIRIQYARCWGCQYGQHYDPPNVHTWMDREDAECKGLPWPLTAEQQAERPCACRCAGGPGGCVEVAAEQATTQQEAPNA